MTQRREGVFANIFNNEPIAGVDIGELKEMEAVEKQKEETRQERLAGIIMKLIEHTE